MELHESTRGAWINFTCAKCGLMHRAESTSEGLRHLPPAGWAELGVTLLVMQDTPTSQMAADQLAQMAALYPANFAHIRDRAMEHIERVRQENLVPFYKNLVICAGCDLTGVIEELRQQASKASADGLMFMPRSSVVGNMSFPNDPDDDLAQPHVTGEIVNLFTPKES